MTPLKPLSICVALTAALAMVACSPASVETCPTFSIASDMAKVGAGTVTFSLSPARDGLTYNWSVSDGAISTGQGTPVIVVADLITGESVTAAVAVGGLNASCKGTVLSSTAKMP